MSRQCVTLAFEVLFGRFKSLRSISDHRRILYSTNALVTDLAYSLRYEGFRASSAVLPALEAQSTHTYVHKKPQLHATSPFPLLRSLGSAKFLTVYQCAPPFARMQLTSPGEESVTEKLTMRRRLYQRIWCSPP